MLIFLKIIFLFVLFNVFVVFFVIIKDVLDLEIDIFLYVIVGFVEVEFIYVIVGNLYFNFVIFGVIGIEWIILLLLLL